MKTLNRLLAVVLILFGMHTPALPGQEPHKQPPKYRLELVYIFESNVTEFIFVVGNSGFKSVSSLKSFIGGLPPGSTLEWAPGCKRLGNEPLLSSEDDMTDFRRFCEEKGIKFILVPSG
ncbi:MAG TPA: hypothetical protein VGV87_19470 [Blastocatellia bacterium]|jgi:hypothetical protein|nr:hypothetical protein [Blastocatellia bacterium]